MKHSEIITEFKKQFDYLRKDGLEIKGIANLIEDCFVISISIPFIFDRRKLPDKFMGIDVRIGISDDSLPVEFSNIDISTQYIWAYQRFELFVDNNIELIQVKLKKPNMAKSEMLDAICFGDFNKHKKACLEWEKAGTIQPFK